jgi:hypothetical protein
VSGAAWQEIRVRSGRDDKGEGALPFAIDSLDREWPNFQFESAAIWAVRVEVRVSHISRPNNGREIWHTLWSVAQTEPKSGICWGYKSLRSYSP